MAAGTSLAADAPAATAPSPVAAQQPVEELQQLDEIWVRGERLAQVIEDAEDEFFALYNKLNENRRFDVHCGHVALSRDSLIMTRACVPGFIAGGPNHYSQAWSCPTFSRRSGFAFTGSGSGIEFIHPGSHSAGICRPASMGAVSTVRRQEYADNVLKVIYGDPQLLDMAGDLASLYREMKLTQQRYVTVKPRHKYARPGVNPRAL
ncbi:MAG TPA: hypothetical protein VMK82_09900 [Steroidobacteraceae bacterium]|nr:hypothetical protein [Steroidobacteraceae bacterium]